jgi:poly(A) polymerase
MFCDVAGNVYDPFGGLDDLGQGAVRFVGDPRQRIEEDVLRLLRFFRFFAYYGRPPPDVPALAACRQLAHRLPELSGERVRGELFRILMAPDPAAAVNLMRGERVLEHILPEAGDVGRLRMMVWLETSAIKVPSVAPDEVRRLAALVVTDAAGAERVADRLKLSNVARYRLIAMAAPAAPVTPELDSRALRRTLRRLGADTARDLVLLQWAGRLAVAPRQGEGGNRRWTDLLAAVDAWRPVELPIKGRDALALGVPHGPRVGALLARVEAWWEAEDYRPDRAACLERLKETLAAAG